MKKQLPIIIAIVLLVLVAGFGVWKMTRPTEEPKSTATNSQTNQESSADAESLADAEAEKEQPVNQSETCTPKQLSAAQLNAPYTDKPAFVTLDVAKYGKIKIALNYVDAPKSSQNFAKLASLGFYDCLTFHRVIEGFVVQGGDPQGTGAGGPGYTVPAEIKLKHTKGAIAMARTGDEVNPKRDSSGSQFYIALEPLAQLDGAYTVFGQVTEGLDIVSKIGSTKTGPGDQPVEKVIITSATVSN